MLRFSTEYRYVVQPLWWLITVPDMNKIYTFISDISLETYIYETMD